ncbi:Nif3-like dinuclear metal center hexameric protein [Flagellimonas allohymeniacidonis]|uniref:GTP cyclohydrolase 1 type 2 homolog n=1 Tax=Flagellimonas allohymeniacidonis TaxID=2517819 RepID=A0A4Q8Q993_9FLAO|nr:Nif3-like dinuclear metal center hexameric protein [Allomuricauda hymeniacidonis]TAI46771.1 Nif3-like dinuclear metal center hexameric protein [Allomuricauda hymeniacidonis]
MKVKDIARILEELAPLAHAEDFDNTGLLVGDPHTTVTGVLVTLDTLENVIDEAIRKECNLVISFHPIIFKGLKKLTGSTYVERVVMKAISNGISIYSMHTALDNSPLGVNAKICEVLGIQNPTILIPKKRTLKKLTTYVPKDQANALKEVLFNAGAGAIGKYDHCSFTTEGIGSFKATEGANPTVGAIGQTHYEDEAQINVVFSFEKEKNILQALFKNHPYEEVAYEIFTLDNQNQDIGMGMLGSLPKEMEEKAFLELVKQKMGTPTIRHSEFQGKTVKKVAVLGGSGAFAISAAKRAKADVFLTADLKYHDFFQAEKELLLADIGHFESEQFTKDLLVDHLRKKITNFAVALSESITNPIKYL